MSKKRAKKLPILEILHAEIELAFKRKRHALHLKRNRSRLEVRFDDDWFVCEGETIRIVYDDGKLVAEHTRIERKESTFELNDPDSISALLRLIDRVRLRHSRHPIR